MEGIDPAKVRRLIDRICAAARDEGANLGEVAQACRCVNVSALSLTADEIADALEAMAE